MSALEEQIAARKRLRAIFYPPAKPKVIARQKPAPDKPESIAEKLSASVRFLGTLETTVTFGHLGPWPLVFRAATVTVRDINRSVARYYGLHLSEILSHSRKAEVVLPRQVAMYLSKCLTVRTLSEIGNHTGGRDHTTVYHAFKKISARLSSEPALASDIAAIKKSLGVVE